MRPIWVQLYETFTEDELAGMLAFYQSPVGQAMLQNMPVPLSKAMAVAQQQATELTPEIRKMTKEYMEQRKNAAPKQCGRPILRFGRFFRGSLVAGGLRAAAPQKRKPRSSRHFFREEGFSDDPCEFGAK